MHKATKEEMNRMVEKLGEAWNKIPTIKYIRIDDCIKILEGLKGRCGCFHCGCIETSKKAIQEEINKLKQ